MSNKEVKEEIEEIEEREEIEMKISQPMSPKTRVDGFVENGGGECSESKLDVKHDPMEDPHFSYNDDDTWLENIDETTSVDELIKESDKMIGLSMELSQPFSEDIQLEVYKEQLVKYLQSKIDKLDQRIRLVQRKYATYKYYNNGVNIGIIILSTIMTLMESIKAQFSDESLKEDAGLKTFFNLSPIFIASAITCSAAIVKFKKFQEKMEGITKTIEKCVFATSRIKKCQEDIIFLKTEKQFEDVKERYHNDIYEYYSTCDQEIQLYLKTDDYGKYLKTLNDMDLNVLILEKEKLKKERYIESEFHIYMEDLEKDHQRKREQGREKKDRCVIA